MKIECLPVGYLRANCYVISDEETGKAAVIDPGGNPEIILGYLQENGRPAKRFCSPTRMTTIPRASTA